MISFRRVLVVVAVLIVFVTAALLVRAAPTRSAPKPARGLAVATFAGGCFWCMEGPFDKVKGVVSTTSGYTGGAQRNVSYEEVSAGGTGHFESVRVVFDPSKVSYDQLLQVYWRNIDPLDADGQFCDRGASYRSAIFVHDEMQRRAAEASKAGIQKKFKGRIATLVLSAGEFWEAEDYHQDYYRRNPVRYKFYRFNCGRDRRLEELWGAAH